MGEVISINALQPHIEGKAVCLNCFHEWQAVAPVGCVQLECPNCSLERGAWYGLVCPDEVFKCNCGSLHYFITKKACVCCRCGLEATL